MRKYSLILLASLSITGCDHYTTKMAMMEQPNANIASIAPAAGGEMTFSGYLAQEYYQLAKYEQRVNYDYPAAKNYFDKAEALSNEKMVMLDQTKTPDLIEARNEIDMALHEYSIPENRYALAIAHSRFDCWVDEDKEGKEISACEVEFRQAMNSLSIPDDIYSEEEFYTDFFDVDI